LTNVQECLILLAFVSYEAVRLWWWGGNCGVVDFEKIPLPRSIPTLASILNLLWLRFFCRQRGPVNTQMNTKNPIRAYLDKAVYSGLHRAHTSESVAVTLIGDSYEKPVQQIP
jgi:hypothetical protein